MNSDPQSADNLGDRMKSYEGVETSRRLDPALPIYARIDGRSFSRFTRGMDRPFDARMSACMIEATRKLVEATHARIGYTQSDEISLVWLATEEAEPLFGAKVQKLASILAGLATAAFTRALLNDADLSAWHDRLPHFDCRVFNLPSTMEATNAFIWREQDARRNAISMAAQSIFSHGQLHKRSTRDMLDMLTASGEDFDAYPGFFREGSWLQRVTYNRAFTADELVKIPQAHRPEPQSLVMRSEVRVVARPRGSTAELESFIFPPPSSLTV